MGKSRILHLSTLRSLFPFPRFNFITLHYTYFFITTLSASAILWCTSSTSTNTSYVDSLFMVVSAMTETGLNTVNLSTLNLFQQVLLFVLMIMGSSIWVSWLLVLLRRRGFERALKTARTEVGDSSFKEWNRGRVPVAAHVGSGHENTLDIHPSPQRRTIASTLIHPPSPKLAKATQGKQQQVELKSVEYRAIRLFSWLVPAYIAIWQLMGCLTVSIYIGYRKHDLVRANGISPGWLGTFVVVSAFNNCGLSLLDDNMIPLGTNVFLLFAFVLLMLAGNTAYSLFLRLSLWLALKLCLRHSKHDQLRETLQFVLDHPRRVYTNLFPAYHTSWLLITLLTLTAIDWIAFEALDIHNGALASTPIAARIADGIFQSIANRSAGFDVVNVSQLAIGFQVLCMAMMYISIYPVTITLRSSNVYEERSLGIFSRDGKPRAGRLNYVSQQLRIQLAHDLWWITLSTLVIVCIEAGNYARDPITYSVFNVLFEVVSAYGPVGLSTGLPNQAYSFSGDWHEGSKVVLCVVMIRGRHRGLPVDLDRAVLLPCEELADDDMVALHGARADDAVET